MSLASGLMNRSFNTFGFLRVFTSFPQEAGVSILRAEYVF